MFKIHITFILIFSTSLINIGAANDGKHQILNFLNFEEMKINLFTSNGTTTFDYNDKLFTRNDEVCMVELNKIRNGLKRMELWAIKRKINCFTEIRLKSVYHFFG